MGTTGHVTHPLNVHHLEGQLQEPVLHHLESAVSSPLLVVVAAVPTTPTLSSPLTLPAQTAIPVPTHSVQPALMSVS